jgi:hypothetical protein
VRLPKSESAKVRRVQVKVAGNGLGVAPSRAGGALAHVTKEEPQDVRPGAHYVKTYSPNIRGRAADPPAVGGPLWQPATFVRAVCCPVNFGGSARSRRCTLSRPRAQGALPVDLPYPV